MIDQARPASSGTAPRPPPASACRASTSQAKCLASSRAPLSAAHAHLGLAVTRQVVTDPDGDTAGQYVSIEYANRFANRPENAPRS